MPKRPLDMPYKPRVAHADVANMYKINLFNIVLDTKCINGSLNLYYEVAVEMSHRCHEPRIEIPLGDLGPFF
ncbi:MAG: hypothetical protein BWY40_00390 [bacterium ADurb.Bin270]|nr:MAG: hypothetical protein BWY40_00390 [bacterium ADurb.Bin270]